MKIQTVRIDVTTLPIYNLSIIYEAKQAKEAKDPLQWLESHEANQLLLSSNLPHYCVYVDTAVNIYVYEPWIFIAYFKHCMGNNLDTATLTAMYNQDNKSHLERTGVTA